MLQAIIFDMDGVLLDSEPFWQQAQLDVLGSLGIPITLEDTIRTKGVRIDQIVEGYYQKALWDRMSCSDTTDAIVTKVCDKVRANGTALPGVYSALEACQATGLPLGLATSSADRVVQAIIESLSLQGTFDFCYSAEHEQYGKPHPAVYLHTAKTLSASPAKCLCIEDSLTGLIAIKAASMRSLVVPEPSSYEDPCWGIADHKIPSLHDFSDILELELNR